LPAEKFKTIFPGGKSKLDKKKKELILIAILIPIMIFVIYNSLTSDSGGKPARLVPAVPEAVAVIAPAGPPPVAHLDRQEPAVLDEKILGMQSATAEESWQRDPFRPPPAGESERISRDWQKFQLSGIISGRMAILNGEAIAVGEEYQGYRLRQAEQYRIILEKDGESFILTLAEE
jgi:hypothetical protein